MNRVQLSSSIDSLAKVVSIEYHETEPKMNLDNSMSAQSTVQQTHTKGKSECTVTMVFSNTSRPEIRYDIAQQLIDAFKSTWR